jgi:lipopolysaccharide export system permease protein
VLRILKRAGQDQRSAASHDFGHPISSRPTMRLITRYVLLELLKVFGVTLGVMTVLMLLVGAAQEAVLQGVGPAPLLKMMPYLLPNALRFAVPGTILFAACSVFGRMSSSNEITATKSLGISPMVLITPALVLSFVLSLVTVWLNDVAVSWGREGIHRVVLHSVEEIVYGMLRTQRSYSTNKFSINVMGVEGRKLVQPTVVFQAEDESPPITLTARQAEMFCNLQKNVLSIVLVDGAMEMEGKVSVRFRDSFEHEIPLTQATNKQEDTEGPSHLPLWRIPAELKEERWRIETLEKTMAAAAAFDMIGGDFDGLAGPYWKKGRDKVHIAAQRIHRLQTEPWRRWATGFSCFFFVMVGAPLAIRLRNSDLWTSFAICFLPILLVYYPLLALGVDRAKDGALPPYSVWLGNLILLLAGLWLMRKVKRY